MKPNPYDSYRSNLSRHQSPPRSSAVSFQRFKYPDDRAVVVVQFGTIADRVSPLPERLVESNSNEERLARIEHLAEELQREADRLSG